jgi:3-hydroxyacyl-CoA dehydrogenase
MTVREVAVIGLGMMGLGIAEVFAELSGSCLPRR